MANLNVGVRTMRATPRTMRAQTSGERGFAMLVAIFALLIMSTVAVAALMTSDDEARSSRATRAANASFYAAEAGLQKLWADSAKMDSLVGRKGRFALAAGGSLDLGTTTLSNGVKYHVALRRYDNGGQEMYGLVAEGTGAGGLRGQQQISFLMTGAPGSGPYRLGRCCDAAATSRGITKLRETGSIISGYDTVPPPWPAGRCAGVPRVDKPGVRIQNSAQFSGDPPATTLAGTPPLLQDPTMDSTAFLQYGDISFAQLRAMANHTIGSPGASQIKKAPAPTLNADGTCKTSDPWNWGSKDPAHACYNYFPIILIRQEVEVLGTAAGAYGQALIVMDQIGGLGVEFELEPDPGQTLTFAGIILGFGCPEIEDGAQMYGAVFGDGVTANPGCGGDGALRVGDGGLGALRWSSCVAQMVLDRTGTAAASGGIPPGGVNRISRGVLTLLR